MVITPFDGERFERDVRPDGERLSARDIGALTAWCVR
jgi:hypothetical protein